MDEEVTIVLGGTGPSRRCAIVYPYTAGGTFVAVPTSTAAFNVG